MLNQLAAGLRKQKGPACKQQDAAPVADAMRAFWQRDMLTFSIPAHNGGRGSAPAEFTQWAGVDAARFDLPMSHGVDTRDRAWGVLSAAQELFAEVVGAEQTCSPPPPGYSAARTSSTSNRRLVAST